MLKQLLMMALWALPSLALLAQPTLSNSIFPAAGDVFERSTSINSFDPQALAITAASNQAQTWDFTSLRTETFSRDSIETANRPDFPTADIQQPFFGQALVFIDISSTKMEYVAGALDVASIGFSGLFNDPLEIQRAPLNYGDNYTDSYQLLISEHVDSVPGLRQLIDSIGLPVSPDSIRINLSGNYESEVDAFGTCQLPDTNYTVLRQHTINYSNVKIEAYFVTLFGAGWQDISSVISSQLPIPLSDTTEQFSFIAEDEGMPVVRLTTNKDDQTVEAAEFKGERQIGMAVQPLVVQYFSLYPQPAQQMVYLEVELLEAPYQLYNLQGQLLKTGQWQQGQPISLEQLPAAAYLLRLQDENGQLYQQILIKG